MMTLYPQVLAGLLVAGLALAPRVHAVTPEEVLKQVRDLSKEKTYTAEMEMTTHYQALSQTGETTQHYKIWGRREADGSSSTRTEIKVDPPKMDDARVAAMMKQFADQKTVMIRKTDKDGSLIGMWQIDDSAKTVLQLGWMDSMMKHFKDLCPGKEARDLSACLTGAELSESKLDGIPCWVVTQAYTQEFIDKLMAASQAMMAELTANDVTPTAGTARSVTPSADVSAQVSQALGRKMKLWIGKADHLQYLSQQVDQNGEVAGAQRYRNIRTNVKLADSLFTIPKKYKVVEIKTMKEYTEYLTDKMLEKIMKGNKGKGK